MRARQGGGAKVKEIEISRNGVQEVDTLRGSVYLLQSIFCSCPD
jgi:hypothetical protein